MTTNTPQRRSLLRLRVIRLAALLFLTLTANAAQVTITSSVTGKGVVLGAGTFESGAHIILHAVPQVDWRFDHWEGVPSDIAQQNPLSLTAEPGLNPVAV